MIVVNGKQMTVNKFDSLFVVRGAAKCGCARILWNGTVVSPALSFDFYAIKSGDQIVVEEPRVLPERGCGSVDRAHVNELRCSQLRDQFYRKLANSVKDPEAVLDRIQWMANSMTSMEVARMSDLVHMNAESTPAIYRKTCSRLMNPARRTAERHFPTVVPAKAEEPATEPLPVEEIRPRLVLGDVRRI